MTSKVAIPLWCVPCLWAVSSSAFISTFLSSNQARLLPRLLEGQYSEDLINSDKDIGLDPVECGKFKILACSSTSCTKMRRSVGIDEFATFGLLWDRKMEAKAGNVQVEESSCLGSCKMAPCVAVEHEDFVGSVSLDGMTPAEFNARTFHRVMNEDDADRIWQSVEGAIRIMAQEGVNENDK